MTPKGFLGYPLLTALHVAQHFHVPLGPYPLTSQADMNKGHFSGKNDSTAYKHSLKCRQYTKSDLLRMHS